MNPVQPRAGAELLIRIIKWGFCLMVLLTLHPVLSDDCQNERSCSITKGIVVQEGGSVEVPLNTSETISDLCVWSNSMSRWVYALEFSSGSKFSSSFKENVTMVDGTFGIWNVSKENTHGSYKLQDNDANCVAVINVSVRDSETTTDLSSPSAPGLTSPSITTQNHRLHLVFLLLLLAVLLFLL